VLAGLGYEAVGFRDPQRRSRLAAGNAGGFDAMRDRDQVIARAWRHRARARVAHARERADAPIIRALASGLGGLRTLGYSRGGRARPVSPG